MMSKPCKICGSDPAVDPYKSVPSRCRECHIAEVTRRYHLDPEPAKERVKKHRQRNPESSTTNTRRWRELYPEKYLAHKAVRNALRRGDLKKPDHCASCETQLPAQQIHGHHDDYTKPLEVIWVCHECHMELHRIRDAETGELIDERRQD